MENKVYLYVLQIALLAMSMVGNAKVVDDMPFFIGSNELCFYPAGFISDSEARVYQILDNDKGIYGKFDGKFAKLFGPDEFSDNPKPFNRNFALPSYIFSSGNYLPVLAIGTAFKNSPISKINMPDCIVSIEESAFYNASNLEYIFLPISLKYIGAEAFVHLGEGKSIHFRSALPPAMEIKLASKFSEIWDVENSDEKELKDSYTTPFGTKKEMIEYKITVPKGSAGFYRLNRVFFDFPIEEYEIAMQAPINPVAPEGLRFGKAGNNALEVLGDLNKNNILEIPGRVPSDDYELGESMMENPFSVEWIGYQAFYNSQFLREISIPSETYYIKDEAFKGSAIEKIIIGDNVRYVGAEAFADLSNLKDVYMTPFKPIRASHFFWDWNVFEGISENAILHYSKDDPRVDINQYPFKEFKKFDIIESGIDATIENKEELIYASSRQGGISIVNSGTSLQECEIYNILGIGVKKVIVNPGDNFVDCEKGIYIVKTIEYSEKLIVK